MKPTWTPAILAILVGGFWATLPVGCHNDNVASGQRSSGGQVADANSTAGGASGGASSAGGAIASGGNVKSGGATGAGGTIGTGGANASGGNAKTGGAGAGGATGTGGANTSGGIIGSGGSGAGGDTKSDAGCAPGWTMCCGQCLSPQAGICAPCSGTGGTGQTGGSLDTGGGAGGGGGGASGAADAGVCPAGKIWCPGCIAGTGSCFTGGCPGSACPLDAGTVDVALGTCNTITTQAACDNRGDCHSVFADPGTCGCAGVNCCMHFNRCADGGQANCTGPVACLAPQPVCVPPYALSYTNVCFEGCILQTECAGTDAAVTTPACPQTVPANGSSCGSTSMSCFYDNCPSTGRSLATCTGGTWSVQTAACGAVSCVGSPAVTTCPSGQICLIVESGTIGVQCVNNTCGQGPLSPACASGLAGCVVNATLNGGATITCNQCPQGGCA